MDHTMSFMHFDAMTTVGQLIDHNTTLTVGSAIMSSGVSYPYGPTFPIVVSTTAYGYDAGADFYLHEPNFGSVADVTFADGNLLERSIVSFYWTGPTGSPGGPGYFIQLVITGVDVPDFDTTFKGVVINGNYIARSARTNYYADSAAGSNGAYGGIIGPPGHTAWAWGGAYLNYFGTSGTIPIIIDIA